MTSTTTTFGIGERVRALAKGGMDPKFVGRVGRVAAVYPAGVHTVESVRVDFPDGSGLTCGAYQLERVR
jgi:hypothetical protein